MDAPIYHLEGVVKAKNAAEDFNGPLDLILHLLSRNRMDIQDIQISLILDQYLAWMNRRRELDLEVASEFAAMAAHLIYIKSRMLLSLEDEETRSEVDQLKASLEARQRSEEFHRLKAAVPWLERMWQTGRDLIVKEPEQLDRVRTYQYSHSPEDLKKAMLDALARGDRKLPPPVSAFREIVGREPYPVEEKAADILQQLQTVKVAPFQMLFDDCESRSEAVATFLAVLELCRAGRILLAGTETDCTITAVEGRSGDLPEFTSESGE